MKAVGNQVRRAPLIALVRMIGPQCMVFESVISNLCNRTIVTSNLYLICLDNLIPVPSEGNQIFSKFALSLKPKHHAT